MFRSPKKILNIFSCILFINAIEDFQLFWLFYSNCFLHLKLMQLKKSKCPNKLPEQYYNCFKWKQREYTKTAGECEIQRKTPIKHSHLVSRDLFIFLNKSPLTHCSCKHSMIINETKSEMCHQKFMMVSLEEGISFN